MSVAALLLPVFVQIGLTFFLLLWTGRVRVGALKNGAVTPADIALSNTAWPPRVTQIANAFHNQLEIPLLFYVVVALILITRTTDIFQVALAWLFVITRLAHAFIHTGSNDVAIRSKIYGIGVLTVLAMWLILAFRVLTAGI